MLGIETFGLGSSVSVKSGAATDVFLQRAMAARASTRVSAYTQGCSPGAMPNPKVFVRRIFHAPRVTMGLPASSAGFGDFSVGGHVFCGEVDNLVDLLRAQIGEVVRVRGAAARSSAAVVAAQAYVDRNGGLFSSVIIGSETCRNVTNLGKQLLAQLNSMAAGSTLENILGTGPGGGSTPVPTGDISPSGGTTGSLLDALGSLKAIAIAGAVIAGVVLVAPLVWRAVK